MRAVLRLYCPSALGCSFQESLQQIHFPHLTLSSARSFVSPTSRPSGLFGFISKTSSTCCPPILSILVPPIYDLQPFLTPTFVQPNIDGLHQQTPKQILHPQHPSWHETILLLTNASSGLHYSFPELHELLSCVACLRSARLTCS